VNSAPAKTRTQPVPARGKLHGMRVVFTGPEPDPVEWTVLDRHPEKGHWWLHRRDPLGQWVTTFARYSQLQQIID